LSKERTNNAPETGLKRKLKLSMCIDGDVEKSK
jgi:hypothetical protein